MANSHVICRVGHLGVSQLDVCLIRPIVPKIQAISSIFSYFENLNLKRRSFEFEDENIPPAKINKRILNLEGPTEGVGFSKLKFVAASKGASRKRWLKSSLESPLAYNQVHIKAPNLCSFVKALLDIIRQPCSVSVGVVSDGNQMVDVTPGTFMVTFDAAITSSDSHHASPIRDHENIFQEACLNSSKDLDPITAEAQACSVELELALG
ncbi:hypothetical protein Ancab_016164 [Ancistrocladus abbreviatus]